VRKRTNSSPKIHGITVTGCSNPPVWASRVIQTTIPTDGNRYYFDVAECLRRVKFIEQICSYPEGSKAGDKLTLDDWQKERIVYPLFGWKKKSNDLRRYRTAFLFIPRKNAKTTLIAAVALSIMFQDGENGAQLFCLGSVKNQSDIIFRIMKIMITNEGLLEERLKIRGDYFEDEDTNSFIKTIANSPGKHGLNAHAMFVDELHEFLLPKQVEAIEAIETSMMARTQPIKFYMTTAGSEVNSRCYDEYNYAKDVERGIIKDDAYLPIVFEADQDGDWQDPTQWKKANPGLGTIIPMDNMVQMATDAQMNPSKINGFKRLHLNQWTNSELGWIEDEAYMAARGKWTIDEVKHLPCYIGLDMASKDDLCAVARLWVDEKNWKFYLNVRHYQNAEKAYDKTRSAGVDYMLFAQEGELVITPGNVTDHDWIKTDIVKMAHDYTVKCVYYDPMTATYIISSLVADGVEVSGFKQSLQFISTPTKLFEKELRKGNLTHTNGRCLRWQFGSATIIADYQDNVKVVKNRNNKRKIVDGIVASIIAFGGFLEDYGSRSEVSTNVVGLDFD
jgi:phage terminase large subunit-like protein